MKKRVLVAAPALGAWLACGESPPNRTHTPATSGPGVAPAATAGTNGFAGATALAGSTSVAGAGAGGTGGGPVIGLPSGGKAPPAGGGSAGGENCSATFAQTELQPVYLAFALDVSGSMGKLDEPYHDPVLKWQPVVRATKSFFTDASSSGIHASLTFFPARSDRCDAERYLEPDVAMTPLPSTTFADAIDAITPADADGWRGGTPTLAVLTGTFDFLAQRAQVDPDGAYAVVLVTDGHPQGCSDDEDDIARVAERIAAERPVPTYVIGVANPPGGPDTIGNLNLLAEAGGTERALIIPTGDPEATTRELRATIEGIRSETRVCVAAIPENPGGEPLDVNRVNVTLSSATGSTPLGYDAACSEPHAWRFDDAANPRNIVLCEGTCAELRADLTLTLTVEFGCERRPVVPR